MIDCILCLQCNRCLKIVIDYEHSLFIMCSFFLALAVGLSLITWGGGGVIDCILCLQCNRCLKIVIDYEHSLFIMCSGIFWIFLVS